jgi:hypothetical protein
MPLVPGSPEQGVKVVAPGSSGCRAQHFGFWCLLPGYERIHVVVFLRKRFPRARLAPPWIVNFLAKSTTI